MAASGSGAWRPPGSGNDPDDGSGRQAENAGWTIFGYLISGMAVYGGIGWLVSYWTQLTWPFPVGLLAGLGAGIVLVIYKYGRG